MRKDEVYFYQLEDEEFFTMHDYPGVLFKKLNSGEAVNLTGDGIIPMDLLDTVVRW